MKIKVQADEDKEAQGNLPPSPRPGHANRPGYICGPGYVAGPMGLSVTRPVSRSIPKIIRRCDVQDLMIRKD